MKFAVALFVALFANLVLLIREVQNGDSDRLARLKSIERRANPFMLKLAGNVPFGLARLEHRGRHSGREYATPLVAEPVPGGFMIAMPYGTGSDWARNLVASGEGVLQHNDVRYRLSNPRIVPVAAARPDLPSSMRFFCWLFGIRNIMRVEVASALSAAVPAPA